jgi:hypothetical protein
MPLVYWPTWTMSTASPWTRGRKSDVPFRFSPVATAVVI